jgi:hypothetical protein
MRRCWNSRSRRILRQHVGSNQIIILFDKRPTVSLIYKEISILIGILCHYIYLFIFKLEMNKPYSTEKEDHEGGVIPWEGHLKPGLIVAAKCGRTQQLYHRTKIVTELSPDIYRVYNLNIIIPLIVSVSQHSSSACGCTGSDFC